jgi:hypothetical protein
MSVLEIGWARRDVAEILGYDDMTDTDLSSDNIAVLQDAYLSYLENLAKGHTFVTAANWLDITRWHFGGDIKNFVKTISGS